MYNNVYQEYINNMLGTIPKGQSDFEFDIYRDKNYFQNHNSTNNQMEQFYPELYKLLYPMIQTACMRNTKPITKETIDEMVKDIYSNFNVGENNLINEVRSEGTKASNSKTVSKAVSSETRNNEKKEGKNMTPNNHVLNDLIRILLIRELVGRPGSIPQFNPVFSAPTLGKPSFRPRDFSFDGQNYDIYEHLSF